MRRAVPLLLIGLFLASSGSLEGQEEVQALVTGQLLRDGVPADSGMVVLHRVTPEEAGPVDSVSVAEDGRFSFLLPHLPVPGSGEIFFGANRFEGIVYPGGALDQPAALDSLYVIRTYASQPAPPGGIGFPIYIREFWIEEAPMGWQVTDAFIVQNPTRSTYVADDAGGVVWQYPLPAGARGARILESGPTPGEVQILDGRLVARNPVAPGESYYMVQYGLDSLAVDLPLPGSVEIARIVLRDPAPPVTVDGLARQPPAEIELGVTYQQWVGQNLRDQVVRIRLGEEAGSEVAVWLSVLLALLLLGIGVWVVNRGGLGARDRLLAAAGGRAPEGVGRQRRDVLVEIAQLDEAFGALNRPDASARARYEKRREALLRQLRRHSGGAGPVA